MTIQPKHANIQRYLAPRLKAWGYGAIALYGVLPVLGVLTVADVGLYLFFRHALGLCYGVWCWF